MADASDLTWCGVAEDGGLLPEPTFHGRTMSRDVKLIRLEDVTRPFPFSSF